MCVCVCVFVCKCMRACEHVSMCVYERVCVCTCVTMHERVSSEPWESLGLRSTYLKVRGTCPQSLSTALRACTYDGDVRVQFRLHREMHRAVIITKADYSRGLVVHGPGWKQFIGNRPLNVCVHGLARSVGSMSLENMIRNTLLGNEGSTPRAKGVQAVYVSKICEGHVSKISQSLQNASSSKGVRAGLI